jgi:arabinofuranan 3-O-arabinosyltransferase
VASRPRQSYGWTLPADVPLSSDAALLDPFGHGPDAQTVAQYEGIASVRAPYSPQIAQFPEHRPFAAFDGDLRTTWIADAELDDSRHYVEATLAAPRDVPYVDVLPDSSNPLVVVTHIAVNGRDFTVHPGWNRLPVRLTAARSLHVAITGHRTLGAQAGSVGGIREVRVPGLRTRELLRPPVRAERALAGADLSHTPFSYVFERTTADDPLRRGPVPPAARLTGNRAEDEAALVRTAQDPETGLDRVFSPPVARRWRADAWVTVPPETPDPVVDRLAGVVSRGATFTGSGRFEGQPSWRASSAFDGSARTAWVSPWRGRAWIGWRTPAPRVLRRLVLVRSGLPARFPSTVRLSFPGGRTPALRVQPDGSVLLPRPVRSRSFRLDVLAAGGSLRPAVAIAELGGNGVPRVHVLRGGAVHGRCGDLTGVAAGRALALRPTGTVAALDAGRALRASACGPPLALPATRVVLHVGSGVVRPLTLRLRSAAPAPLLHDARRAGRVTDPGDMGRGSYDGVRVQVSEPSWLVLGESYNRGWHAVCDGRSLGAPSVVDGFANGWRVKPGCTRVSLTFGPQKAVWWGYAIGALACLVLLVLMAVRRPRRRVEDAPAPIEPDDRPWRLPARQALLVGVVAAVVFGFVFALRAGLAIGPVTALVVWRGMSARTMILIAGALLAIVVPLIYVIFPATDRGGYAPAYPVERLGAHWVTVGAVVLLVFALARTLSRASRANRAPAPATADAPAARSRP